MALLLPSDYELLREVGLPFEEGESQRYFIFANVLPRDNHYTVERCDVLVQIPPNYPQAGNDMFWTYPRLQRSDGKAIPATHDCGFGDNRVWNGREYCRWSRHWDPSMPGAWRIGKDNILSIYRRIEWALQHPDCK